MSTEEAYVVAVNGLSAMRGLQDIPASVTRAAYRAINTTLTRTRTASARDILAQVAFPSSYLSPSGGRLSVSSKASSDNLEGSITGRFRPTSLARFVKSGSVTRQSAGVTIEVNPGLATRSKRMFLIRLRAGTADLDTQSNLGLAIRLKRGERVDNKRQMVKLSKGLYLLYGPSVSQVFLDVANDEAPVAADFLETEFSRLLDLDL